MLSSILVLWPLKKHGTVDKMKPLVNQILLVYILHVVQQRVAHFLLDYIKCRGMPQCTTKPQALAM